MIPTRHRPSAPCRPADNMLFKEVPPIEREMEMVISRVLWSYIFVEEIARGIGRVAVGAEA
jgi:hypothetical protein